MKLTIENIGKLKKDYQNDNELNICLGVEEVSGNLKLTTKEKEMVEIITDPDSLCKIILSEGIIIEKYIYKKGKKIVYAENIKGDLNFTTEDIKEKMMASYASFIGNSPISVSNFNITLTNEEFITFMSLVDITREKMLVNISSSKADDTITFKEIREHLEKPIESSLTYLFKNQYSFDIPDISATKPMLNNLIAKKVIEFTETYKLIGEYDTFATNFLLPNLTLTINSLEKDNTEAYLLYISAGIKNNVLIDFGNNDVDMMSISASSMLNILENVIEYKNSKKIQ